MWLEKNSDLLRLSFLGQLQLLSNFIYLWHCCCCSFSSYYYYYFPLLPSLISMLLFQYYLVLLLFLASFGWNDGWVGRRPLLYCIVISLILLASYHSLLHGRELLRPTADDWTNREVYWGNDKGAGGLNKGLAAAVTLPRMGRGKGKELNLLGDLISGLIPGDQVAGKRTAVGKKKINFK